jgi:hypothetical protein
VLAHPHMSLAKFKVSSVLRRCGLQKDMSRNPSSIERSQGARNSAQVHHRIVSPLSQRTFSESPMCDRHVQVDSFMGSCWAEDVAQWLSKALGSIPTTRKQQQQQKLL